MAAKLTPDYCSTLLVVLGLALQTTLVPEPRHRWKEEKMLSLLTSAPDPGVPWCTAEIVGSTIRSLASSPMECIRHTWGSNPGFITF